MIDQEMLQAIKQVVGEAVCPLQNQVNTMQEELQAVKEETRRVAITQENTVIPKIDLIYENQVEIIEEHRRMQQLETDTSILNDEVSVLQHVAKDHAKRITALEMAR